MTDTEEIFACQKGKGTTAARDRLKDFLHQYYRKYGNDGWVLKIDIKGYYPNMSHEFLEWFEDESDGEIYAHMYAEQYMRVPGRDPEKTKIISIKKRDLTLSKDKDAFFHAYGWPGPDYEIFFFNDYGVTWAFKEEDIKKMTLEEWDAYNGRNNNA